jgi:hypothetical protein
MPVFKFMSTYTTSWAMRYQIPSIQQQAEVATVHAATDIKNEDSATPDHANRLAWARWTDQASSIAAVAFMWPICNNPAIIAAVEADHTGATVLDSDVQFVVNSNLDGVIASWVAGQGVGN